MRLVTFVGESGIEKAGALIDGGQAVLDLQRAYTLTRGGELPALSSVLALAEAGKPEQDLARSLVEKAPVDAVTSRSVVRLRAPIQPPALVQVLA